MAWLRRKGEVRRESNSDRERENGGWGRVEG